MSPTGRPGRNKTAGFSLFEIAVVLFIISLFFVLVTVPIEGILSGGDLGQATRMLMSEVSKLRGEAAYTRRITVSRFLKSSFAWGSLPWSLWPSFTCRRKTWTSSLKRSS